MAQNIGLSKINELGEVKENSSVNFADIINLLWTLPNFNNKFPTLSSIDPSFASASQGGVGNKNVI